MQLSRFKRWRSLKALKKKSEVLIAIDWSDVSFMSGQKNRIVFDISHITSYFIIKCMYFFLHFRNSTIHKGVKNFDNTIPVSINE